MQTAPTCLNRPAITTIVVLLLTALTVSCGFGSICCAQGIAEPDGVVELQKALIRVTRAVEPGIAAIGLFLSTDEFPFPPELDLFEGVSQGNPTAPLPARLGSGVMLQVDSETQSALILTTAELLDLAIRHGVVQPDVKIAVRLHSSRTFSASIHALDPRSGLAVLRVDLPSDATRRSIQPIPLPADDHFEKGMLALVFGDPWEVVRTGSGSVSLGIISNLTNSGGSAVPASTGAISSLHPWMQIDARSSAAASGSAIVNLKGQLLGIGSASGPARRTPRTGLAAIPCTPEIRNTISQLLEGKEIEYGDLHVQLETKSAGAESADLTGQKNRHSTVVVTDVITGSPAERAGLKKNDLILQVNGKEVATAGEAVFAISAFAPGSVVDLQVDHPGTKTRENLKVRLGKWPVPMGFKGLATANPDRDWRGMRIDFPAPHPQTAGTESPLELPRGVLIREVRPATPAAIAGLKAGEIVAKVGEQPVETPSEFQDALKYWPERVPITLSDGREVIVEVK
ncbi:PDZ domain-containing protein [Planctomicrobium sp. SH661]|uniref:PDZ domain-containing protein n=1 Tax=Planctomicrobium sp. SH661 TaxID=3448124 RepID=UPI003F5BB2FA